MAERRGCVRQASLLVTLVALLAGICIAAYWYLSPYRSFGTETFVEIEHGMSSRAIAAKLERQGVVRSRYGFLLVRALHPHAPLQAGEYRFGSAQTPFQVFDKIAHGDIFFEELTIPEGSNIFDIAGLLANSDTVKPADFLSAAADPALVRDLDARAPNLEGYLFPSSYRVTHKTTARQLCRAMTDEFRKEWKQLGGDQHPDRVHETVVLASLVEKESASPQERPEIASVFLNRLRVNMPLQCDPTTVYAALLENRYRGTIHKSDLASRNAYNTYAHPGLPPGAIANPGVMSLKAVLHPLETSYLYFVAKPDHSGTHAFSSTLEQHEKAVQAFRRGSR